MTKESQPIKIKRRSIPYFEFNDALRLAKPGDSIATLIFHRPTNQFLIVKEEQGNEEFGRKSGTWNTVCETVEESDYNLLMACRRALKEEVIHNDVKSQQISLFNFIPGSYESYDWKDGHKVHRLIFEYLGDPSIDSFTPENPNEISDYRWVTLDEIRKLTKRGELVSLVLPFILKNKSKKII